MNKNYSVLNNFTYLYLYIPSVIFLFGWVKLYISIPLSILLTIILIKLFIDNRKSFSKKKIINYLKDNWIELLIILYLAAMIVFISGLGGYMYQNNDHIYRNTLFVNLIGHDWPVMERDGQLFMVYYFAFWLPSAVIGKIFGLSAGYFSLYIWGVLGVFLFFNYIKNLFKGHFFIPIIIFILFSGLDVLETFIFKGDIYSYIVNASHIEWATKFQFSSFATQLFWVYNQCIPAWLLTFYIWTLKDNRIIGLLIAISLIFCTLPSIGLSVIALYKIFWENGFKKDKFKGWIKHTFTWENLLVGLPLLIIFGTFVKSNAAGGIILFGIPKNKIINYFITITYEFFIYYALTFKYYKRSPIFYISFICLCLCPFVSINGAGDFCMRVSIPFLVLLYMMVVDSIYKSFKKKNFITFAALIMILLIGSVTSTNEIRRTFINNKNYTGIHYGVIYSEKFVGQNFYGYTKDSLFCKYFMK